MRNEKKSRNAAKMMLTLAQRLIQTASEDTTGLNSLHQSLHVPFSSSVLRCALKDSGKFKYKKNGRSTAHSVVLRRTEWCGNCIAGVKYIMAEC